MTAYTPMAYVFDTQTQIHTHTSNGTLHHEVPPVKLPRLLRLTGDGSRPVRVVLDGRAATLHDPRHGGSSNPTDRPTNSGKRSFNVEHATTHPCPHPTAGNNPQRTWMIVPYAVGVKNAGIPAPPARQRSASVPWGHTQRRQPRQHRHTPGKPACSYTRIISRGIFHTHLRSQLYF